MDDQRFDRLTRAWAGQHSRRRMMGAMAASVGAGWLSAFGFRGRVAGQLGCGEGLTDCVDACADIANDRNNCGACGNVCESGLVAVDCVAGECVRAGCPPALTDCGGVCADLASDTANCGACGNVCDSSLVGVACVNGECVRSTCPPALTDCGDYCADTANDVENCGGCGVICESGLVGVACVAGECVRDACPPALADCGDYCADTANDVENCGGCGFVCTSASGDVACVDGACIDTGCPDGLTTCGDLCVDLASDLDHCGACGNTCESDLVAVDCIAGECVRVGCPPGETDCGQFCADTANDPANCGACGNACPSGTCETGVCVEPLEPTPGPTDTPAEEPTGTPDPTATPDPSATPAALPADDATATATGDRCPSTTEDENEAIVRRWHEDVLTFGDTSVLDEMLDPAVIYHAGSRPDLDGAAAVRQELDGILVSFPDIRVDVEQAITEDDTVVIRWTATGTNDGPLDGRSPTGRTISWTGIDIFRIDCGRIAEVWTEIDRRGQEQQLTGGGTPTPTA